MIKNPKARIHECNFLTRTGQLAKLMDLHGVLYFGDWFTVAEMSACGASSLDDMHG